MQKRMNQLFQRPLGVWNAPEETLANAEFAPPIDVYEDENRLTFTMEIPGLDPKEWISESKARIFLLLVSQNMRMMIRKRIFGAWNASTAVSVVPSACLRVPIWIRSMPMWKTVAQNRSTEASRSARQTDPDRQRANKTGKESCITPARRRYLQYFTSVPRVQCAPVYVCVHDHRGITTTGFLRQSI